MAAKSDESTQLTFDELPGPVILTRELARARGAFLRKGQRSCMDRFLRYRVGGRSVTAGVSDSGRLDKIKWLETLIGVSTVYRRTFATETASVALLLDVSRTGRDASTRRLASTAAVIGGIILQESNAVVSLGAVQSGRYSRAVDFSGSRDVNALALCAERLLSAGSVGSASAGRFRGDVRRYLNRDIGIVISHYCTSEELRGLRFNDGQMLFLVEPRVEMWRAVVAGASPAASRIGSQLLTLPYAIQDAYEDVIAAAGRPELEIRIVSSGEPILKAAVAAAFSSPRRVERD